MLNISMTKDKNIARFAINANLDGLQDIYDVEDAMDTIISGLMESGEVKPDTWLGLRMLRDKIDVIKGRAQFVPMIIREVEPDSHKPELEHS